MDLQVAVLDGPLMELVGLVLGRVRAPERLDCCLILTLSPSGVLRCLLGVAFADVRESYLLAAAPTGLPTGLAAAGSAAAVIASPGAVIASLALAGAG